MWGRWKWGTWKCRTGSLLRSGKCRRLDRLSGPVRPALAPIGGISDGRRINESDVLATHQNIQNKTKQNMRFTVRLRIVYTASAPHRRHNESSTEEDDADDLLSATCCSDWYDFHVSGDTGSSCRQLLWGVSDQATRRRRTCLLRPRSFLQAPAARFVALISRWRCVDWN